MHITCINSKDNTKSNDSNFIFIIWENMRLNHRCPLCWSSGNTFYRDMF